MKKKIFIAAIILFVSSIQISALHRSLENNYYRMLSRYGEWIEIEHDCFVWHPTVVNDYWEPYSIGKWYWTETGWVWDADETFIWLTHNYGEWEYDRYYGWIWYPTSGIIITTARPFYNHRPIHIYRKPLPINRYKHVHVKANVSRDRKRHKEPHPVMSIRRRNPR